MLNEGPSEIRSISPQMVRRTGGGWLAIAPESSGLSIGVTAATEEVAREKFRSVFARWIEILGSETKEAAS